eukprot:superscaffoldBa00000622_g6129
MHGYKYPPVQTGRQHRDTELQPTSIFQGKNFIEKKNQRLKMLCSRCVIPFLAFYLSLEKISAAVLPSGFRNKREVNWMDQELFARQSDHSDQGDLSVGDAGDMGRDVDGHPSQSEAFLTPTELSLQRQHQNQNQNQNQYQYKHKSNEKRRKVARLDSIGSFQMSGFRNRNDEPDASQEDYKE